MSESTLRAVERGAPGVGTAAYLSAIWALGLLSNVAPLTDPNSDATGLLLEAQRRNTRVRLTDAADDDF